MQKFSDIKKKYNIQDNQILPKISNPEDFAILIRNQNKFIANHSNDQIKIYKSEMNNPSSYFAQKFFKFGITDSSKLNDPINKIKFMLFNVGSVDESSDIFKNNFDTLKKIVDRANTEPDIVKIRSLLNINAFQL